MVSFFQELAARVPPAILFLAASIGHGYLWIIAINLFYAQPIYHKILNVARRIDFTIVLAGPFVFAYALDLFGSGSLDWSGSSLRLYLAPYTMVCFLIGVVLVPVFQVLYWLRPRARQARIQAAQTLDIAAELGTKPVGRGKKWKMALVPGNQIFQVEFITYEFRLPQLPEAWDGLSILHLTDQHLCGTPDRSFHQRVIDHCLAQGVPDLVCVTGDIVDSSWHHRWIMPVLGRLRWHVAAFTILGNHDALYDTRMIRRRLSRLGFTNVGNCWHQIEVRGQPLVVVGHEGPWFRPLADMAECPANPFRLCLSHSPDAIGWARANKIDLMLAGHVHGGQIRVPLIGSIFVPSRHSRRYDCGTFWQTPTLMHVGRGLAGQHPLRLFCKPEVSRIILRKA